MRKVTFGGASSLDNCLAGLRFFFTVTLDRPDLARRLTVVRQPRRLPAVLSLEEITCKGSDLI